MQSLQNPYLHICASPLLGHTVRSRHKVNLFLSYDNCVGVGALARSKLAHYIQVFLYHTRAYSRVSLLRDKLQCTRYK